MRVSNSQYLRVILASVELMLCGAMESYMLSQCFVLWWRGRLALGVETTPLHHESSTDEVHVRLYPPR